MATIEVPTDADGYIRASNEVTNHLTRVSEHNVTVDAISGLTYAVCALVRAVQEAGEAVTYAVVDRNRP